MYDGTFFSRRRFLQVCGAGLFITGLQAALPLPLWARSERWGLEGLPSAHLNIGYTPLEIDGRSATATGINGTYWYHSHSFLQEQSGVYGPLINDPKDGEPFNFDRDYMVVLSDWSFEKPETIFSHINLHGHYYNYQQRTIGDFFADIKDKGLKPTINERLAWGNMRISPVG